MLDCDGWELATAYHDAFDSSITGHPTAVVPAPQVGGVINVTFAATGWTEKVVREAINPDRKRRELFVYCLIDTATKAAAGVEA